MGGSANLIEIHLILASLLMCLWSADGCATG